MDNNTNFWMSLMDKINRSSDIDVLIPEALEELCSFLSFGAGFVYKADHTGVLRLSAFFKLYNDDLPEEIDPATEFTGDMVSQMLAAHHISFREKDTDKTPIEEHLAEVFHVRSMDLVPITFDDETLVACVGIADRRGAIRTDNENPTFTQAILSTLGLYVKTDMYRNRAATTEESLKRILDNLGIDVYVNDFYTHEILYLNKSMAEPYGGVDRMIGEKCWQALYEGKTEQCDFCPQKKIIDENGNPTKLYSWDYQRPFDGSWFRVLSAAFRWVDGRLAHVVSSVDITENKQREETIRKMAEYDKLTGLPNRHKLTMDSEAVVEREGDLYVLFLDLDGFKKVNDTLGHHAGDELLRLIGEFFEENELTKNRAYRYGGDEFVILCESGYDDVEALTELLLTRFAEPWDVGEDQVTCPTSIGVAHYPDDDERASELIRKADHAMYYSKNNGKSMASSYNKGDIVVLKYGKKNGVPLELSPRERPPVRE